MSEQSRHHDYEVGDVVWARFADSPWWPSVVVPKERVVQVDKIPPDEVLVECFNDIYSFGLMELNDIERYRSENYYKYANTDHEMGKDVREAMKTAEEFEKTGIWAPKDGDTSNLVKNQNRSDESEKHHDNNHTDDELDLHKTKSSSKDPRKPSKRRSRTKSDVNDKNETKSRKRSHHETKKEKKKLQHPKKKPEEEEDNIQPDDKRPDKKRRKSDHRSASSERYKEKKRKRSSAKDDNDNEDYSRKKINRRENDQIVSKNEQPSKSPDDESEEDIDSGHADDLEEEEIIPRKATENRLKPSSQSKTTDIPGSQSIDGDKKEQDKTDEYQSDESELDRALQREEDVRREKLKLWLEGKEKAPKNEIVCKQDDFLHKMRPLMKVIKRFQDLHAKSESPNVSADEIEKAETEICEISDGLYQLYFDVSVLSLNQLAARMLKKIEELRPVSVIAARALRRVLILWIDIIAGALHDPEESKHKKHSPDVMVSDAAESSYKKPHESHCDEQDKESKVALKQESRRESGENPKSSSTKDDSHENQKETKLKSSKDIGLEKSPDSNSKPSRSHDSNAHTPQAVSKKPERSESGERHRKTSHEEKCKNNNERPHDDEKDQDVGIPRKAKELPNRAEFGEASPTKKGKVGLKSKPVTDAVKMNGNSPSHSSSRRNSNGSSSAGSDKRIKPSKPSSKEKHEEKGKLDSETSVKRKKELDLFFCLPLMRFV